MKADSGTLAEVEYTLLQWIANRIKERELRRCVPESEPVFKSEPVLQNESVFKSEPISRECLEYALTQELGGLIYELTPLAKRSELPLRESLERCWLQNISAHIARGQALAQSWPPQMPPPLLLKGVDFEFNVLPRWDLSPGARASSDWDLLLPSPHYEALRQHWTARFGEPTRPRSARFPNEAPHEVGFYIDQLLFELHRDPAPTSFSLLRGRELWERSHLTTQPELRGLEVRSPTKSDRLFIWLTHYAKAGGAVRLSAWIDLTLILIEVERGDIDVSAPPVEISQRGLTTAWRDAITRWIQSPLCIASPYLTRPHQDTRSRASHFKDRLTWRSSRMRIAWAQLRMCAPSLRLAYITRALYRMWRER